MKNKREQQLETWAGNQKEPASIVHSVWDEIRRDKAQLELRLHGTRRNVKDGCYTCLTSKSKCGEIVNPLTNVWANPLTDDKQKEQSFFFCLNFHWQGLIPHLHVSSMICEEGEQPIGGARDEGLSTLKAVSIGIQVSRQDSPEGADVTSWLLSIIRSSEWSGTALTAGNSPAAFSCKTWANMNWMNKLLDRLKTIWTKN